MRALIAVGFHGAAPVDQVLHRRVAPQQAHLINFDRRACVSLPPLQRTIPTVCHAISSSDRNS